MTCMAHASGRIGRRARRRRDAHRMLRARLRAESSSFPSRKVRLMRLGPCAAVLTLTVAALGCCCPAGHAPTVIVPRPATRIYEVDLWSAAPGCDLGFEFSDTRENSSTVQELVLWADGTFTFRVGRVGWLGGFMRVVALDLGWGSGSWSALEGAVALEVVEYPIGHPLDPELRRIRVLRTSADRIYLDGWGYCDGFLELVAELHSGHPVREVGRAAADHDAERTSGSPSEGSD